MVRSIVYGSIGKLSHLPRQFSPSLAAVAFYGFAANAVVPDRSFADENGISFWIPGQFGSLAAVPMQPGWSFATIYYHTSVKAGGAVAAGREITIGQVPRTSMST